MIGRETRMLPSRGHAAGDEVRHPGVVVGRETGVQGETRGLRLEPVPRNLDDVTQKIEDTVKKGKAAQATGPDLPYTSRAKKVLELSLRDFRRSGVDRDPETRDRLRAVSERETELSAIIDVPAPSSDEETPSR